MFLIKLHILLFCVFSRREQIFEIPNHDYMRESAEEGTPPRSSYTFPGGAELYQWCAIMNPISLYRSSLVSHFFFERLHILGPPPPPDLTHWTQVKAPLITQISFLYEGQTLVFYIRLRKNKKLFISPFTSFLIFF